MPPDRDRYARPQSGLTGLVMLIQVLGIIVLIVAPSGVLVLLAMLIGDDRPLEATTVALLVGLFVVGVVLGGLLLAVATLTKHALASRRSWMTDRSHYGDDAAESTMASGLEPDAMGHDHARHGLDTLSDLSFLEPAARKEAIERLDVHRQRQAAEGAVDAINRRQLGKARAVLGDMEARFGSTPTVERLRDKVAEAAERQEPLDYVHTKRRVEEAIVDGRWATAEELVRVLCYNHPDAARCRKMWDDTRRARLHAHVEACATQHHWTEALAAAQEFLHRFPATQEAESLKGQIDTLRANAEIHQRKQYETRFKSLVGDQQFAAALRLAKLVIHRFPESPQAAALRPQLSLLERRLAG